MAFATNTPWKKRRGGRRQRSRQSHRFRGPDSGGASASVGVTWRSPGFKVLEECLPDDFRG